MRRSQRSLMKLSITVGLGAIRALLRVLHRPGCLGSGTRHRGLVTACAVGARRFEARWPGWRRKQVPQPVLDLPGLPYSGEASEEGAASSPLLRVKRQHEGKWPPAQVRKQGVARPTLTSQCRLATSYPNLTPRSRPGSGWPRSPLENPRRRGRAALVRVPRIPANRNAGERLLLHLTPRKPNDAAPFSSVGPSPQAVHRGAGILVDYPVSRTENGMSRGGPSPGVARFRQEPFPGSGRDARSASAGPPARARPPTGSFPGRTSERPLPEDAALRRGVARTGPQLATGPTEGYIAPSWQSPRRRARPSRAGRVGNALPHSAGELFCSG